jgi:pyruvate dehydrogenase E1 component beta subunit
MHGLLAAAIRDPDPVIVCEHKALFATKGDVPDGEHVSIITHGKTIHAALQAAQKLEKDGIRAEVLDLRSIRPLDVDAILATVRKTNRAVYVEEGWPYAGVGAQIVSIIQEEAFDDLDAPVLRVTQADIPMPYAKNLEQMAKPSADRVVKACEKVLYRNNGKS